MNTPLISSIVLLVVCAAGVAEAQAPTGSRRPYKALFGGAANDPSNQHSLDLTFSLAEGYDDNVLSEGGGLGIGTGSTAQLSGMFTSFAPSVTYGWTGKRVQFSATGGSSLRYYQRGHEFLGTTHYGAIGLSTGSTRTRLSFNQSVSLSPAYFYGLFPSPTAADDLGYVVGAGADYAVQDDPVLVYDTSVNLNQSLTSRSSVNLLANFRYSDLSRVPNGQDLRSYGAGGRYLYNLSRHATLHFGYIYRQGQYSYFSGARPMVAHDIDAGVDYHRPLSFSRRTRFDFSVGSSIVSAPAFAETAQRGFQYQIVGNASLTHDMGRTWQARLAYNRGVGFVEGFQSPVFSDAVNVSLNGFVSRRVDLSVTGGVSLGDSATATATQTGLHSYTASARMRSAINTTWAVFGEYTYYNYDLGSAIVVSNTIPRALDRNTVRVGLSAWLPLLRK